MDHQHQHVSSRSLVSLSGLFCSRFVNGWKVFMERLEYQNTRSTAVQFHTSIRSPNSMLRTKSVQRLSYKTWNRRLRSMLKKVARSSLGTRCLPITVLVLLLHQLRCSVTPIKNMPFSFYPPFSILSPVHSGRIGLWSGPHFFRGPWVCGESCFYSSSVGPEGLF